MQMQKGFNQIIWDFSEMFVDPQPDPDYASRQFWFHSQAWISLKFENYRYILESLEITLVSSSNLGNFISHLMDL